MKPRLIKFSCTACGARLAVPEAMAGSEDHCPKCSAKIKAPAPSVEPAPPPRSQVMLDEDPPVPAAPPAAVPTSRNSLFDDFLSAPLSPAPAEAPKSKPAAAAPPSSAADIAPDPEPVPISAPAPAAPPAEKQPVKISVKIPPPAEENSKAQRAWSQPLEEPPGEFGMGTMIASEVSMQPPPAFTRHVVPSLGVGLMQVDDAPRQQRLQRRRLAAIVGIVLFLLFDAAVLFWVFRERLEEWWAGLAEPAVVVAPVPAPASGTRTQDASSPPVDSATAPASSGLLQVVTGEGTAASDAARAAAASAAPPPQSSPLVPPPRAPLPAAPVTNPSLMQQPSSAEFSALLGSPLSQTLKTPVDTRAPPTALAVPEKKPPPPEASPPKVTEPAPSSAITPEPAAAPPKPAAVVPSGVLDPKELELPSFKLSSPLSDSPPSMPINPALLVKTDVTPPPPPPPLPESTASNSAAPKTPPADAVAPKDEFPAVPEPARIIEKGITAAARPALEALKSFLAAPTWQERLKWCQKPEAVKTAMTRHYSNHDAGPVAVKSIDFIDRYPAKNGNSPYCMFELRGGSLKNSVLVLVEETPKGPPRVDWEAFIEFKDQLLWEFLIKPTSVPQKFRVMLRRKHAFDRSVPDSDKKDAFELSQPGADATADVFIPQGGTAARVLSQKLGWGDSVAAIVELAWRSDGARRWVEIQSVPAFGWRG